jgi:O-antigen ligase
MALPLLPEFLVGYVLILWFVWRIYSGHLTCAFLQIPRSFAFILPYFVWYLWRWSATGWTVEGGHVLVMHLQWLIIPLLLLGLPQKLKEHAHQLFFLLWAILLLTSFGLCLEGIIEWTLRDTPSEGFSDHPLFYIGLSDPLMHPGYLSMIVSVFFMTALIVPRPAWVSKRRFLLGQLFLLLFLVMLSSRMILGVLLLTWPIAGHFWKNFHRKAGILITFSIIFLILAFSLGYLPQPIDHRIRDLSQVEYRIDADSLSDFSGVTIRLAEWKGALHAIKDQPFVGHGPGLGHKALMEAYEKLGFHVGLRYHFNAHNQYLQTALDLGWIGSLLLVLSMIAVSFPFISSGNKMVLWYIFFFLLCSFTESTLLRQKGTVMLALYLPLLGLFPSKKVRS